MMRVVRSLDARAGRGRRFGAWLGIAALLLQLITLSAHFHPEDFAAPTKVPGLHTASGGAPGSLPWRPGALLHDDCALCFTLHVTAGAALSAPPSLPAPTLLGLSLPNAGHDYRLASAPYLLFRTRAPPTA